jgi:hypothetical protein
MLSVPTLPHTSTGNGGCNIIKTNLPSAQEAEAIQSSQVPPELQSAPVEELMDYVVEHLLKWSEQQGW